MLCLTLEYYHRPAKYDHDSYPTWTARSSPVFVICHTLTSIIVLVKLCKYDFRLEDQSTKRHELNYKLIRNYYHLH